MIQFSTERNPLRGLLLALPILTVIILAPAAVALDVDRSDINVFIGKMVDRHGFDRDELRKLFIQVETRQSILDAIQRPAEKTKPWHEYRQIFITEKRIKDGVAFWRDNRESVEEMSDTFGISAEVVVAVIGVETAYGRITGKYRVIDALSTLAFDYPPRAPFFGHELEQYLLLTREEDVDPLTATGSYAGAMGLPQFMPSSFRIYAVDASQDGKRDIWTDWSDVLASIANYMKRHGWVTNDRVAMPVRISANAAQRLDGTRLKLDRTVAELRKKGVDLDKSIPGDTKAIFIALDGDDGKEYWVGFKNYYVITRYNHSLMYAMAVFQLGNEIAARLECDVS